VQHVEVGVVLVVDDDVVLELVLLEFFLQPIKDTVIKNIRNIFFIYK
jgi:hypothetical protein